VDPVNAAQPAHVEVSSTDMQRMRLHADACLPEEACGLLGGAGIRVQLVVPVENVLHSPVRYHMDPAGQLAAFQRIEASGFELVGIFHSHPNGPEHPSLTDIAEAFYPEAFQLIWHRRQGEWGCNAFWINAGQVQALTIHISPA
jgi:proteasome lid subunit RPN8/RPN11